MTHLKRLQASKNFPIERKKFKFTVAPRAGPHAKEESIPLQIIIRDVLKYAETIKQAKKIIKKKEVKIDGKVRTDQKYPVGLMDVIEIPKIGEYYRIIPKTGKLIISKITKEKAKYKLCQIKNKTNIKKGNIQLNLHDGRNIIIPVKDPKKPKEDAYSVGDTLIISLPEQKILEHIKLEKGNLGMVVKGKHAGEVGELKDIRIMIGREPNKVILKTKDRAVKTIKDYVFIIGKDKPKIILP